MIFKRRHTANFTTIGNTLFDDERLKLDELGILTWLLSRPENWEVRRPQLRKRFKIGRDALRRIVTNLVKYGWATACRKRLGNGTFYTIYEIRDEPSPELTDDEVKAIFSLESGEDGSSDDVEGNTDEPEESSDQGGLVAMECGLPALQGGLPDTADPPRSIYKTLTNTIPTKSERELARAREKHVLMLAEFKRRYPTAASDDQTRIEEEWFKLGLDEGEPALAGIVPFLEKLKRDKRTTVPAAWKYLKEKRWTLLDPPHAASSGQRALYPPDSIEATAIRALHEIAGRTSAFWKIFRRPDGSVSFPKPMTEQLRALAQAPPKDEWVTLDRAGGGSWEDLMRGVFEPEVIRTRFAEGCRAPWPFAPSKDGKIYVATGPPMAELSEQDAADFR